MPSGRGTLGAASDLPGRSGKLPDSHSVPDLLAPGLRIVFCGTALGRVSAEKRAYYANPTNLFWRSLHETGLTPHRVSPADWPQLLGLGIGLTDLAKTHFGNDDELPADAFDVPGLLRRIRDCAPAHLAFTSKTAAAAALGLKTGQIRPGELPHRLGPTRIWALPSPSGQARRFWDIAPWQALADAASA